jgi:hypothetical protein
MRKRRKKFEIQRRIGYEQGKQDYLQRQPLPTTNRDTIFAASQISGRLSNLRNQMQPQLRNLVKIGFPDLKINNVGYKYSGPLREQLSIQQLTEQRKKVTTRNNHKYIYSRISDNESFQDLADLSARSRARIYLDNQSFTKLRKGKLNHTTNTYGCDSHQGSRSKSQDKDLISLTSRQAGRIKSMNVARAASRGQLSDDKRANQVRKSRSNSVALLRT